LYYQDLWAEFERYLLTVAMPFRLFITVADDGAALSARVTERFPDAVVLRCENRGRDVGPFMQLLRENVLDDVDLVCKLHGKRSAAAGPRALLGEIWRRANLQDLVGSPQIVDHVVARFVESPNLGMIGSRRFRVPNAHLDSDSAWSQNKFATLALANRIGVPPDRFELDFFAGTMFWVRREVLDQLKPLNLAQDQFPEEAGQLDGTLHHALERLFGALPRAMGMSVGDIRWTDIAA
jgi:lipopolysaccharide biosynthesis protein